MTVQLVGAHKLDSPPQLRHNGTILPFRRNLRAMFGREAQHVETCWLLVAPVPTPQLHLLELDFELPLVGLSHTRFSARSERQRCLNCSSSVSLGQKRIFEKYCGAKVANVPESRP